MLSLLASRELGLFVVLHRSMHEQSQHRPTPVG
ncbi:hypothetical protein CHELA40_14250 [Chelatococcus asaccharovorans]|nr:hypothetical protein CHELA40_14250 [Chelatococcus asaccharovorans]